jgi:hypothetical protein
MTDALFSGAVPGIPGAFYKPATLPDTLPDAVFINPWTQVASGKVLLEVPGVARYLTERTTGILVHAEKDADPRSVAFFLNGPARGFLIHQRGDAPLEASTVVSPGGAAVAFSASSGLGTSTLAVELCRRGWLLVADGITRVSLTAGRVLAWPSHDKVVLWRSACQSFGIDADTLQPIRSGMEKYYAPMPAARGSAPLRAVVRLVRGGGAASIVPVEKSEIVPSLRRWQYRWAQIEPFLDGHINPPVARMAENCQVLIMNGARDVSPFELADLVTRAFP